MEIILILLVLILLFGAKRLPDIAKGLGQSMRVFKKETSKMSVDDEVVVQQPAPSAPSAQAVQQPSLPPAAPQVPVEERARQLEEEAVRLRARAAKDQQPT
jgi:sec-independent protein translocase protein TatA